MEDFYYSEDLQDMRSISLVLDELGKSMYLSIKFFNKLLLLICKITKIKQQTVYLNKNQELNIFKYYFHLF